LVLGGLVEEIVLHVGFVELVESFGFARFLASTGLIV
jgi:hypothetical protein